MKKILIVVILMACLNVFADSLRVGWTPNSEPDLAGYKIYYGPASRLYTEFITVSPLAADATIDVPPMSYMAITAVNNAGLESDHSNELLYRPVIVDLVLEQSRDLPTFFEHTRWELFRVPDVLYNRGMLKILQTLNITHERVGVITSRGSFKVDIDTRTGGKFFRSVVAARSL